MNTQIIRRIVLFALMPTTGLSLTSSAPAAPVKKPAVAKPAAKKSATDKPAVAKPVARTPRLVREVLGTEQLEGYEGALGETFTLGKSSPLNFTLRRAEYSVSRSNIGGYAHFAKGDEKLLVLHYTVQNPQQRPFNYSTSYLSFKAVDASDVTRNYVGDIAREGTGESLGITLHPGQKVDAYTTIKVAARGEVPKLIVAHAYEPKTPIIRYDLRGQAQKLIAPFADPADATGATALRLIPATAGTFYPVTDHFDARLDAVTYTTEPIKARAPGAGKRYCVATFMLLSKGPKQGRYGYSYFRADLKDADGEKVNYNTSMLKAARDEEAHGELEPGEEVRVRFYWVLPENVAARTVLLQYGYDRESRTYAFDVAAAPAR